MVENLNVEVPGLVICMFSRKYHCIHFSDSKANTDPVDKTGGGGDVVGLKFPSVLPNTVNNWEEKELGMGLADFESYNP